MKESNTCIEVVAHQATTIHFQQRIDLASITDRGGSKSLS